MEKKQNPKQWRERMMESVGGRGEIAISSKETVTSEQSSNVFTHSPNCSFTHSYLHSGLHSFSHKFNHSFPHSLLPLFTKSLSHELPHAAVSQALNACHFHPQTCLTPSLLDLCIDRSQSLKCYFHASLPTAPGLVSLLPGSIPACTLGQGLLFRVSALLLFLSHHSSSHCPHPYSRPQPP